MAIKLREHFNVPFQELIINSRPDDCSLYCNSLFNKDIVCMRNLAWKIRGKGNNPAPGLISCIISCLNRIYYDIGTYHKSIYILLTLVS